MKTVQKLRLSILVLSISIVISRGSPLNAKSDDHELDRTKGAPRIVAIGWQQETETPNKLAYSQFWNSKGELLSERDAKNLEAEFVLPSFHSGGDKYSTPLILVFEFEDGLPVGTGGVRVTTELPDGKSSSLGSSMNRRAGKKTASRHFSASSSMVSLNRKTFQWPDKIGLKLKYPADAAQLIKTIEEIPHKPIQLARGVSWSVEAETGYEPGGDGTRYPAGVLEVSKSSLELLSFDVHVYTKGSERRLPGSYSTIRERGDQLFEIRVSERFPREDELDRIEFYRQRFKRRTFSDVPLRIDLISRSTSKN